MKRSAALLAFLLSASAVVPGLVCPPLPVVVAASFQSPADHGISGLEMAIRRLRTTARLIHTTAHPDDEDGGMLALESRGLGADVLLLTLNRGEGGQNKTGAELFDALGVLRTLELLKADDYYGVEQRFTRVADFGFSKTPAESFEKWGGHDVALADMVRVIREFRPDVLVSRFQGAPRDGHGHHQAAGILTVEAFKAAADADRFPDQIKDGLLPWQVKKLYTDNVRPGEDYTVKLDTGAYDPAIGESYQRFAVVGLNYQLSQGEGGFTINAGHRYSYYKLLDSRVPTPGLTGHETGFFDGIDTSLTGLAARAGDEGARVPALKDSLAEIDALAAQAASAFTPDNPARCATPLLAGFDKLRDLMAGIKAANLSPQAQLDLETVLSLKADEFARAANLALGVTLEATVDAERAASGDPVNPAAPRQTLQMAVRAQGFTMTARLVNGSGRPITVAGIHLEAPPGWKIEEVTGDEQPRSASAAGRTPQSNGPPIPRPDPRPPADGKNAPRTDTAAAQQEQSPAATAAEVLGKDDVAEAHFRVTVSADAAYTRPYWYRADTQTDNIYNIDDYKETTLPLPDFPVHARADYQLAGALGEIRTAADTLYIDPLYGQERRPLAVGPLLSVEMESATRLLSTGDSASQTVSVRVRANIGPAKATLRLGAPPGWRVQPLSRDISFRKAGDADTAEFEVKAAAPTEGLYTIRAVAETGGQSFSEGYSVVGRHDIGVFYYYRPSVQVVSEIRLATPPNLKVGYIMGAGDEIPEALRQVGIDVKEITPRELASGDLTGFGTIVLGIRAYDTRNDVRDNNRRLLDYVAAGGTLVVQYNQNVAAFNANAFAPYPATAGTKRVTVEEAPVRVLDPADSIMNFPNRITPADFDGWVQERGTYFMEKWSPEYHPILSSNDPGEAPLDGGLLRAAYGKGAYIYAGYAFFRQLPAGVPGAVRLFVNIISAGHERR